jgi:hypothetical protein
MPSSRRSDDADSAIEHLKRIAHLAESLKQIGAAIYEHHWDCLCFGSWTITAGRRKDCFEFSWDGRDFFLTVSHSAGISGGRPQVWRPHQSHKLSPDDGKDPLAFIDEFFQKRKTAYLTQKTFGAFAKSRRSLEPEPSPHDPA